MTTEHNSFLSILCIFACICFTGSSLAQTAFRGPRTPGQQLLAYSPINIKMVREAFHEWSTVKADTGRAEQQPSAAMQKLVNAVMMQDQYFLRAYNPNLIVQLNDDEALDYYDDNVQLNLSWYLHFIGSTTWFDIQSQLDTLDWRQKIWTTHIQNIEDLYAAQKLFYGEALKHAEARPEKLRRKFSERFWQYDDPPYPDKGYDDIQKNINNLFTDMETSEICLVKLDVARTGELLRVQLVNPTAHAALDSAIISILTSQTWQPALHKDQPFRATVQIPLRIAKSLESD